MTKYAQGIAANRLKAADLWNEDTQTHNLVRATISSVTIDHIPARGDDPEKEMPLLHFPSSEKALGLNVTNTRSLVKAFGEDSDAWIGKRIEIFVVETQYQGNPTWGIRVRPVAAPVELGGENPENYADEPAPTQPPQGEEPPPPGDEQAPLMADEDLPF